MRLSQLIENKSIYYLAEKKNECREISSKFFYIQNVIN